MQETPVQFLGWEDPLEKGKATHSMDCIVLGIPKSQILWEVVEIEREMILEISPGCSLVGLMLKLKLPILWPPDAKS